MVAFAWFTAWYVGRCLMEAPHDWFVLAAALASGEARTRYTRFWHRWDAVAHAWTAANFAGAFAAAWLGWLAPQQLGVPAAAGLAALLVVHAFAVRGVFFDGPRNHLAGQGWFYVGAVDDVDRALRWLAGRYGLDERRMNAALRLGFLGATSAAFAYAWHLLT